MIDFSQFIRPENIPSLTISIFALVIAGFSARFTYKNYKINEGDEWKLSKVGNKTWKLERNHRKKVVLIGLAILPSFMGYKISIVGARPNFYSKGSHILFKVHSSSLGSIEDVNVVVFSKPFLLKKLNRNSFSQEVTQEILKYDESKDGLIQAIDTLRSRNNPPLSLLSKVKIVGKKKIFKLKTRKISHWYSSLL